MVSGTGAEGGAIVGALKMVADEEVEADEAAAADGGGGAGEGVRTVPMGTSWGISSSSSMGEESPTNRGVNNAAAAKRR